MKNKVLLSAFFFLLLCNSCSQKETEIESVVTNFKKSGSLTARVQKTAVPFLLPRGLFIIGDKLVVYKEREEYMFDVYKLPDCNYLFSSGQRGQGPDDYLQLDARSLQIISDKEFRIMDAGSTQLKTIIIDNNQMSVKHSEMFPGFRFLNGFYPMADSIYLTLGGAGETNEFSLFDKKNAALSQKGEYPQWVVLDSNNPFQQLFTYIKNCVVHPDGKKFAAFYARFKRWRIYDQSAEMLRDIEVRIPPYQSVLEHEPEYYIGQPQVVGKYIYTLCSNIEQKQSNTPNNSELQIWDWEGSPISCFSFDRNISMFVINEKNKKIIALDHLIENEFYIYDLPTIKN